MLKFPIVTKTKTATVKEEYWVMSDGTKLYTWYAIPDAYEKCPIVLVRTPYSSGVRNTPPEPNSVDENIFIKNGYALMYQHCRGTGLSEGFMTPYENEREDGLKTLELIRKLPSYNEEIFIMGGSYYSTVHLCYLDQNPFDIKAAALSIQTDRMYNMYYRNGCCANYCSLPWWLERLERQFPVQLTENAYKRPFKDIMKRVIGEDFPAYTNQLLNDTENDFWKNKPNYNSMDNLKIPVLLTEGWYDYYTVGMFDMWERIPEETKKKSVFQIGPWGHSDMLLDDHEYELKNGNLPKNFQFYWFESIRKNQPYEISDVGKIKYYSIGTDTWKTMEYPPKKNPLRLYFTDKNTLSDHSTTGKYSYEYNPENIIDFKFFNIFKAYPIGREGVISFVSEETEDNKEFFGKIRWHMNVSSDCEDTAFFIRIYFIEDDIAYNSTETITTISYINKNYKPTEKILIDIETPNIGFTLKKGNKIRVDISSCCDRYVPHANVKGHWAEVTETKTATNTLYCEDAFIELNQI